jgi:hypothetical protein
MRRILCEKCCCWANVSSAMWSAVGANSACPRARDPCLRWAGTQDQLPVNGSSRCRIVMILSLSRPLIVVFQPTIPSSDCPSHP